MTTVGPGGAGYIADPQPIGLAPSAGKDVQLLSGTTKAVIRCSYPIRPGCFSWTPMTVNAASLQPRLAEAGVVVTNFQNLDLFQDDSGGWHAAVTIGVNSPSHPDHWTVIAHAHPTSAPGPAGVPLSWSADAVLTGSFDRPAPGNYDGKYFQEGDRLYLLYVDSIAPRPALRNAIMLQPMISPALVAPASRTILLTPGDRFGELESERYANTDAKLVEAPYLSRIGGKYALVYSTGAYLTPGYKAGVAWSDTLIPLDGGRYRKVLLSNAEGSWKRDGGHEVRYLIQSAQPQSPNFTGDQVIGPGVAAAVQGPGGAWWLYFNGFAPNDMPLGRNGRVDGSHRRPYYLEGVMYFREVWA